MCKNYLWLNLQYDLNLFLNFLLPQSFKFDLRFRFYASFIIGLFVGIKIVELFYVYIKTSKYTIWNEKNNKNMSVWQMS